MSRLIFNPGLTSTGFRTTWPCSLNLLFGHVLVIFAVLFCDRSLPVGSLRNHDGDAEDNFDEKMNV